MAFWITRASVLALALLTATPAAAFTDLSPELAAIRAAHDLPALAAAVIRNGEIIAAGAAGTRVAGQDNPVTVDDRFHIGSDGKALTATLAGSLVDEDVLAWDSTVGEVLGRVIPGLKPALARVTLAQLLSHSSGIPTDTEAMLDIYFNVDAFDYNPDARRLRAIATWNADHEPEIPEGSPFQYANFGYLVAGAMMEQATGQPWEVLVRERVLAPLGLDSAGFGATTTPGRYDAPVGHLRAENGTLTPMLWGPAADMPPILGPAGIVHMSILDFARWAGWNAASGRRGPALVTPATLAEIHRPHVSTPPRPNPPPGTPGEGDYGLGWGIDNPDWTNGPVLLHNGSNGMNLAKILVDPNADLGIVATTNVGGAEADAAAFEVLQRLYRQYVEPTSSER